MGFLRRAFRMLVRQCSHAGVTSIAKCRSAFKENANEPLQQCAATQMCNSNAVLQQGNSRLGPFLGRLNCTFIANITALWNISSAIYKVAHAAHFLSCWCAALHVELASAWIVVSTGSIKESLHGTSASNPQSKLDPLGRYKASQSLIVIPKKAHYAPATAVDISTGRDRELAKLRFRMLASVPHWRRELGLRGGNWIAASPVFSEVPLDSERPRGTSHLRKTIQGSTCEIERLKGTWEDESYVVIGRGGQKVPRNNFRKNVPRQEEWVADHTWTKQNSFASRNKLMQAKFIFTHGPFSQRCKASLLSMSLFLNFLCQGELRMLTVAVYLR